MMKQGISLAGLLLALSQPVHARDESCTLHGCLTPISFQSVSVGRSYGLLIAAPDSGCRRVRFRVEGVSGMLGQTPPLGPGELAVVHMGQGFPEGQNMVVIAAIGCKTAPAATRRVTFAKMAPDHGWRAVAD